MLIRRKKPKVDDQLLLFVFGYFKESVSIKKFLLHAEVLILDPLMGFITHLVSACNSLYSSRRSQD